VWRPLIVRADANGEIGYGHLSRCLALSQAAKADGYNVMFITACDSPVLNQRLGDEGFGVVSVDRPFPDPADWKATSEVLAVHPGAWVMLDGYHFDETYQQRARETGHRLLVIDDMAHLKHYYADIVLNQNLHAEQLNYSCESYTRLLLGTRYVLLRREFLKWRGWKREIPEVARKVLVTLGGGNPDNVTLKVIQALQQVDLDGLEAVVVVGGSNPYYQELQSAIRYSPFAIRLEHNVTNMPELMAWADVAVSAGGSTCWEVAFMGLPNLVLILADNQRLVAERLDTAGVAVNLGWYENLSSAEIAQVLTQLLAAARVRMEMSWHGQQLVDGEGVNKVLRYIRGETISLRQVRGDDCRLLWEWANDPDVRAVSFSEEPILWEQHVEWFNGKIRDSECIMYIALTDHDHPIGQVRYDIDKDEATISVSVDRQFRGLGCGSAIIKIACERVFASTDVHAIHAYVKANNAASAHAFVTVGFEDLGTKIVRECQVLHLVLQRQRGDRVE